MYADVLPFAPREAAPAAIPDARPEPIRLIRAAVGNTVRLIPVQDIICLEAADKYVTVVTAHGESQVRMPLRELAARLAGIELVQIHRSVLVNAARMVSATRDELGHYNLTLRGLEKTVKVSRAFSHLFRPM
jgi:DNA-binding LytR/AlgR family response regulator